MYVLVNDHISLYDLTLIPRPSSSTRSSRPTRTRQRIQTEACQQLQDTHPKDLPPLYLKIINIIRFIWIHSPYLNTPEIIAGKPPMTSKCARVRNRAGGGGRTPACPARRPCRNAGKTNLGLQEGRVGESASTDGPLLKYCTRDKD